MQNRLRKMTPRNGHTLVALFVKRISGCAGQKESSLTDQDDHGVATVAEYWDGPVEYRSISTKAKGERIDRPELDELEAELKTREIDVLYAEDLGRMVRGYGAAKFCGLAVDCGTRVISPNDGIDTADGSWERDVLSASSEHVASNEHTSRRIKQKGLARFLREGKTTLRLIFGYDAPQGAKTFSEWYKGFTGSVPADVDIYGTWYQLLDSTLNGEAVADWLNGLGIPFSKKQPLWDGRRVLRISRNPILKGRPARCGNVTVKEHGSGRRVSRTNPDGPEYRDEPHLAYWTEERFDALGAKLRAANKNTGRKKIAGVDPRYRVSKKRTYFPGQHIRCGICEALIYWGGHGQTDHMECSRTREYRCWVGSTFDGHLASRRILAAVLEAVERLPQFDAAFRDRVAAKLAEQDTARASRLRALLAERKTLAGKIINMKEAVKSEGMMAIFADDLREAQACSGTVDVAIANLESAAELPAALPDIGVLKAKARELLGRIDTKDMVFHAAMQRLLPDLAAHPYRLCHKGKTIVFRATATLDLRSLVGADTGDPGTAELFQHRIEVDLFEPVQHVAILGTVVRRRAEGATQEVIAAELGVTVTAVQNSASLYRAMQKLGLTDAYVPVTEPPEDLKKLRRHKHPRYRFRPIAEGGDAE